MIEWMAQRGGPTGGAEEPQDRRSVSFANRERRRSGVMSTESLPLAAPTGAGSGVRGAGHLRRSNTLNVDAGEGINAQRALPYGWQPADGSLG